VSDTRRTWCREDIDVDEGFEQHRRRAQSGSTSPHAARRRARDRTVGAMNRDYLRIAETRRTIAHVSSLLASGPSALRMCTAGRVAMLLLERPEAERRAAAAAMREEIDALLAAPSGVDASSYVVRHVAAFVRRRMPDAGDGPLPAVDAARLRAHLGAPDDSMHAIADRIAERRATVLHEWSGLWVRCASFRMPAPRSEERAIALSLAAALDSVADWLDWNAVVEDALDRQRGDSARAAAHAWRDHARMLRDLARNELRAARA
jgi:hypothetical protein